MSTFKAYCVPKGFHFSWPFTLKRRRDVQTATFWIRMEDLEYLLVDGLEVSEDQYDWSKLVGLSFHFWDRRKHSLMVGWRFIPERDEYELNAYYHLEHQPSGLHYGRRGAAFTDPLMAVRRKALVEVTLTVDRDDKRYYVGLQDPVTGEAVVHSVEFLHDRKHTWDIRLWFGGNRAAPRTLRYLLKEISST